MPIGFIGDSEGLKYILGMPWPCALLLVCAILLIVDMFCFGGDGLTYFVHILLTMIVLLYLPISNWLWLALIGVFIYGGILALHFFCWRTIISKFINHILTPDRIRIGNEALIGTIGTLRNVDGRRMIHVGEEWISCRLESPSDVFISPDTNGMIAGVSEDGTLIVIPEPDKQK